MTGIHGGGRGEGGRNVLTGDIEAGEESPEGRIAVDEGGEDKGTVLDNSAEGEEEQREQEECEGGGGEGGGGAFEKLSGGAEVEPRRGRRRSGHGVRWSCEASGFRFCLLCECVWPLRGCWVLLFYFIIPFLLTFLFSMSQFLPEINPSLSILFPIFKKKKFAFSTETNTPDVKIV